MDDYLTGLEEHLSFHYASEGEADRAEAYALGAEFPERAWILTDRDAWHANPYYKGPPVRHPEDDDDAPLMMPVERANVYKPSDDFDDIPF